MDPSPSALITTGPVTKQIRTAPVSQSLLKWFRRDNLKPTYPASSVPSHGNHDKASCTQFSLSLYVLTPLVPPCGALPSVAYPSLGIYEFNQVSLQRQLSPDLLASPYLSSNKRSFKICWDVDTCSASVVSCRLLLSSGVYKAFYGH